MMALLAAGTLWSQTPEKKDTEKPKPTTLDAWRDALPQNEAVAAPIGSDGLTGDGMEVRESTAEIENRVIGMEERFLDAVKRRDAELLRPLLAHDFMPTGMSLAGPSAGKTYFLARASKESALAGYQIEKTTARVYDQTVVTAVKYKKTPATAAGISSGPDLIATGVWVLRENKWEVVSHHLSPPPKQQ
jgi:hypothetical protein